MSQKGRNDIQSTIDSNIYDNNNKEILAQMVRNVLEDFKDSYFNLIDDQLKNTTYQKIGNNSQTLEQYLNTIVGAIPIYGSVQGLNIATNQSNLTTTGIISSAAASKNGSGSLININFSQGISNRRLIPVLSTLSSNMSVQHDVCTPIIRRISSTNIVVGIKEIQGDDQDLILEIIAI